MRLDAARGPSCRPAGCQRPVSLSQEGHSLALPPRRIVPGAMVRTDSRRVDVEPPRAEAASRAKCPLPAACHARAFFRGGGHRLRAVDSQRPNFRMPTTATSWRRRSAAARSISSPTTWPTFRLGSLGASISRRSTPTVFCPGHSISIPPKRLVCCASFGRRTAIRPSRRRRSFATWRLRGFPGWLRRSRSTGTSSRGKRCTTGNRLVSALPYDFPGREKFTLIDATECLPQRDRDPGPQPEGLVRFPQATLDLSALVRSVAGLRQPSGLTKQLFDHAPGSTCFCWTTGVFRASPPRDGAICSKSSSSTTGANPSSSPPRSPWRNGQR